jgi:hypothetical protein
MPDNGRIINRHIIKHHTVSTLFNLYLESKVLKGSHSMAISNKVEKIDKELYDSDSSSLGSTEEMMDSVDESNKHEDGEPSSKSKIPNYKMFKKHRNLVKANKPRLVDLSDDQIDLKLEKTSILNQSRNLICKHLHR